MSNIGTDISQAARLLSNNELVAIPTETVYGLATNGLNADAVLKIYEAKNRPSFNPLILHVADIEHAKKLVVEFPEPALRLAEKFWPGPLTLVLRKREIVPDIVTAGLETVGIRVPRHPLTLKLLRSLDFPLAVPSANLSGYISPTTAQHVGMQLGGKVAYILDGGKCEVGIESTIVKVNENEVTVLRLGGIELEKIQEVAGANVRLSIADGKDKPESPGMMVSHYAPRKRLMLGNIAENIKKFSTKKIGVLSFKDVGSKHIVAPELAVTLEFVLSPSGNLHEAARNLFSYLRLLDESQAEIILAEPVSDEGLGKAINDRLRRAAAER